MDHALPEPDRIDGPPLLWAAVGSVPPVLLNPKHHRLQLADVGLDQAPAWLGIDRALAAAAAWRLSSGMGLALDRGVLVADAGTVLSLTLLDASGAFLGGQLVPGLQLQLAAMGQGTVGLPCLTGSSDPGIDRFPQDTAAAMRQGVASSLLGVVRQALEISGAELWLSGGDAPVLAHALKERSIPFHHDPDLVLKGLVNRS